MIGYACPTTFDEVLEFWYKYVGLILFQNLEYCILIVFVLTKEQRDTKH